MRARFGVGTALAVFAVVSLIGGAASATIDHTKGLAATPTLPNAVAKPLLIKPPLFLTKISPARSACRKCPSLRSRRSTRAPYQEPPRPSEAVRLEQILSLVCRATV